MISLTVVWVVWRDVINVCGLWCCIFHKNQFFLCTSHFFLSFTDINTRPQFVGNLKNVTEAIGREATFSCNVRHLAPFKVVWNSIYYIYLVVLMNFLIILIHSSFYLQERVPSQLHLVKLVIKLSGGHHQCSCIYIWDGKIF